MNKKILAILFLLIGIPIVAATENMNVVNMQTTANPNLVKWIFNADEGIISSPAVDPHAVYFGDYLGSFHAFVFPFSFR